MDVEVWATRPVPDAGRHILADYDDTSIVVYQAYRPAIARYALENQVFGGPFSFGRMTWIKPNFTWMMHRSGWGKKPGQEVVLRVRIRRAGFEAILRQAVHAAFECACYADHAAWKARGGTTDVRLQWDPDHGPAGEKLARRAIQLGLRGEAARLYATDWIEHIADVTPFAHAQHALITAGRTAEVHVPVERVYPVSDPALARFLLLAPYS